MSYPLNSLIFSKILVVHGGLSSVTNFDLDDIRGLPIGKSLQAVSLKNKGIVFFILVQVY